MDRKPPLYFLLACMGLVGVANVGFAQAQGSLLKSSKDVRITLEIRWLELSDNYTFEMPDMAKKLPTPGSHVICDQQQADLLLKLASGDKRSSLHQVPTLTIPNGARHELLPCVSSDEVQGNDTIQATVSNDRQSIDIQVTWAKQKDGKERLPMTTATVPMGSHLLVRTVDSVTVQVNTYSPSSPSYWEQLKERLFNWKPPQVVGLARENRQVFLLVTPHIEPPKQRD